MFVSHVASYNDNILLGTKATTADDNFDPKHPLYQAIAQLSELRKQYPILRRGQYQDRFYQADKDMFAFARVDPETGAEFLMVFNSGEQAQTINVTQEGKRYRLMTTWPDVVVPSIEDAAQAASAELTVTLPRLSYAIYTTAS